MNKVLVAVGPLVLALGGLVVPAAKGESPAAPVTIEYYYKLVPGGTKEWLGLYRKNHLPILQQLKKEGLLESVQLYERRFHAASPEWDYKVVLVWRDWAALEEARLEEPGILRSLYPNKNLFDREEKRRWELTLKHWDDVLSAVAL